MNHPIVYTSIGVAAITGCVALINSPKTEYLDGTRCECDSIVSEFYSEGNVWSETPMRNGMVHGAKKVYYMNGDILRVVEYQNDTENGIITDYTPDGIVRGRFVNGIRIN